MDTKIIEYVIAIAEEKSLSKAAERLYLSQPALSQRLKKLEDELGTPLFVRGKDGLSITDAGRIYVNGGHSILQIKREALKKLTSMNPRQAKNTLRFACATSSAIECIPTFRKACSDIELLIQRCNTPKAKEDLIMGRADLGVLLTSSLQHTALEYPAALDRRTAAGRAGRTFGVLPEGYQLRQFQWHPGRLFYSYPLSLLRTGQ